MTKPASEHSDARKSLYPKELSSRHRAIMRLLIAGHTRQDIATDLGFNQGRLSVIINSPIFQGELKKMEEEVRTLFVDAEAGKHSVDRTRKTLNEASEKAAIALEEALLEPGAVKVSAAAQILDRTGYGREEKIKASILVEPSQGLIDMISRNKGEGKPPSIAPQSPTPATPEESVPGELIKETQTDALTAGGEEK